MNLLNKDYETDYICALSNVEGMIAEIEEEDRAISIKEQMAHLEAMPDIPNEKNYWGKTYQSECVCGGIITAMRSTVNGHLRAKCDRCGWNMIE